MRTVFSRKVLSTVVAGSLLFSAGGAVYAAPKGDAKPTGRTEQQVQTGEIEYNDVTVPRKAEKVTLTGIVKIDGPQLVVKITDPKNNEVEAKVTKVGDKSWAYEAEVDVSKIDVSEVEGKVPFEISAKTIYANGKNTGVVHTSARSVTQTIDVPYIKSFIAKNDKWTAYDRSSNLFTFTFDIYENWSNGDEVFKAESTSQTVSGKEYYVTAEGTSTTLEVPVAYRLVTFSEQAAWEFNKTEKTYTGTAGATIINSRGDIVKTVPVTKDELQPGGVYEFSYSEEDKYGPVEGKAYYTAPEAPKAAVFIGLDNVQFKYINQNKNKFKIGASYTILYSDDSTEPATVELTPSLEKPKTAYTDEYELMDGSKYRVTLSFNLDKQDYEISFVQIK